MRVAVLANDRARIATDEGIAPEMLAAFDRFEEKRFALPANFAIGRQRRFEIGQQPARDRDQGCLRAPSLLEFFKRRGELHSRRKFLPVVQLRSVT